MATETAKTLTEVDGPSLSSEQTKPDETLTDGSDPAPGPDPVSVSTSINVDLNGDNGDLVLRRRIVETEVTVKKIFGVEDEASLVDEKDNENESVSGLDLEKDVLPVSEEAHGSDDGSEKKGGYENVNAVDENRVVTEVNSTDKTGDGKQQVQDADNDKEEEEEEEDDDDDDFADVGNKIHNYHVGDFVWGKIRSHPWWPGQIYNPSDASAYAAKIKIKNRLLVAYFGDGSFSWCHPSQLRPFVEDFEEMSKQSSSKNFVYAVENALDEISRAVELEMRHLYVHEGNETVVAKPVNAGIREEADVPKGSIGKLLIAQYGPAELLAMMRDIARVNSFNSLLQFVVLKSWLSSFYLARGGYKLCSYSEPRCIEGLEDIKNENSLEIPAQKVPEVSADKLYQRRKQKSVADLMKEDIDLYAMSASANKKRGRKKKDEVFESPGSHNGSVEKTKSGKKKMKVSVEKEEEDLTLTSQSSGEKDDDDDDVKSKDETVKSFLPREKKKSRYLSPPYMDLKRGIKNSNSKKDSETDSKKVPQIGVRMTKAASLLIGGSPAISKCSVEKSSSKLPEEFRTESPKMGKNDRKLNINLMEVGSTLNEVLHEVRSAAIDPLRSREEKNLEMMTGFFSAYRDSVFLNGSNYKLYNKGLSGKKRKSSSNTEAEHLEVKSGSKKAKHVAAANASLGCTEGSSGGTKNDKEAYKKDSPALLVTFPPGFTLPSKDDIIKKFSKFGALNETETDVFYNSFCARLVFINSSDAEEAFNISVENNPFGAANVNFRLRYPSSAPRHQKIPSSVEKILDNSISEYDDEASRLGFVKQKLEVITKVLEDSGSEISEELKSKLEGEMKGLVEKVVEMIESIST